MSRLLLETSSSDTDYNADVECAVLDITPKLLKSLLVKRRAAEAALAIDKTLWEVYFWGSPIFFYYGYELIARFEEQAGEKFGDAMKAVLPSDFDLGESEIRVECEQTIIRVDRNPTVSPFSVAFCCSPRHTNLTITTEEIAWPDLVAFSRGKVNNARSK